MVPSSLAFLPACKGLAEMWMLRNKFGQGKFLLDRSRAVPRTLPCIHLTCVYTLLLQKPCTGPLSRVRFLGEHHGPTPPPPPQNKHVCSPHLQLYMPPNLFSSSFTFCLPPSSAPIPRTALMAVISFYHFSKTPMLLPGWR